MRTIVVAIITMLTFGVGLSFAQSGDDAAIKKLNEDYAKAIQKGDVKAALACHTKDAVRAAPGSVAVGSTKIEAALKEQFANADTSASVELKLHNVNMITDDVAIVHGGYTAPNGTGHFIRTLLKEDGSWKIAAIQIAPNPN